MEASSPWKPTPFHPPCPICACRGAAEVLRPSVQRLADGAQVEADVLHGDSLAAEGIELDELTFASAEVVAIRIPRLTRDDVIQIRIPRACVESTPPVVSTGPSPRRFANAVVLPDRWYLLEASLPTIVSRTNSGCTRVEFDAPGDDTADVLLTIVRHSLATAV